MTRYNQETELQMLAHFSRLQEKDKRHYVALEALKLGQGGKTYLRQLFGISDYLIRKGIAEIVNQALLDEIPEGKQRRAGGGRKKKS